MITLIPGSEVIASAVKSTAMVTTVAGVLKSKSKSHSSELNAPKKPAEASS